MRFATNSFSVEDAAVEANLLPTIGIFREALRKGIDLDIMIVIQVLICEKGVGNKRGRVN
jgi:hypothetical protein